MKKERGSKLQIVAQLVRMEGNAAEVDDFIAFWRSTPAWDLIRIKEDETNLMRPDAGHAAGDWKHPCHYLWRGPLYVKYNGDVYPCCQSYGARWRAHWQRGGNSRLRQIWNSAAMQEMRRLHASGRGGEIDVCAAAGTTIPHPGISGREFDAARPNRAPVDAFWWSGLTYLFETTFEVTRPPKAAKSVISHRAFTSLFKQRFTSSRLNTARSLMLCLAGRKTY